MIRSVSKRRIEYGDFQTPLDLANQVCQKLLDLGIMPDSIIEPTCGIGNFINASSSYFQVSKNIIGVEINPDYLEAIKASDIILNNQQVELFCADFFQFDWLSCLDKLQGNILVLGNLPWVTNSQQGTIGGDNLPQKANFQNFRGFDAIAGKSNFDISEWMLIQIMNLLQGRDACLAMLCKLSVSRKILSYLHSQKLNLAYCATYKIDAKKYFDANVDACLLFCQFAGNLQNYFCDVFASLDSPDFHRIGYRHNLLIRDIATFDQLSNLYTVKSNIMWRSGIKHDCSQVMEFRKVGDAFINGMGETVELEEKYLFPLLKGSDIAQNRVTTSDRYVLVTQKYVGEPTDVIANSAPKTWKYLVSHADFLDQRKSKIYQKNPRFAIFGVGQYTFAPWKIAICGLYKKLEFRLIGNLENKPVAFDDTVYFLSFEDENTAIQTFQLLTSKPATDFYSSLIFWDEKRPIKSSTLNRLDLTVLNQGDRFSID